MVQISTVLTPVPIRMIPSGALGMISEKAKPAMVMLIRMMSRVYPFALSVSFLSFSTFSLYHFMKNEMRKIWAAAKAPI